MFRHHKHTQNPTLIRCQSELEFIHFLGLCFLPSFSSSCNQSIQCHNIQVHVKKLECREKVIFFCNLFQKVKLSDILDSLRVK